MIKFSEKKYDAVVICGNCGEVNLVSPKVGTPLYQTKCPYCGCTGYLETFDCDCE